ncbi:MAG TPA: hypothetical protein VEC36_06335 [Patescibacteria group bacterium]|nr:hypothetical protein [Patescibacteria group bacterium]
MQFKITSKNAKGAFDLLKDGRNVTSFEYENWFSSHGSAVLKSGNFEIRPKNMWHSSFDIIDSGADIGDITMNWRGHIIIPIKTKKAEKTYILKTTGFWNFSFVLIDDEEREVLRMRPEIKWTKMYYDYTIEVYDETLSVIELEKLLVVCGYSTNLYMNMMAAAVL